jgi:hypothetical protein
VVSTVRPRGSQAPSGQARRSALHSGSRQLQSLTHREASGGRWRRAQTPKVKPAPATQDLTLLLWRTGLHWACCSNVSVCHPWMKCPMSQVRGVDHKPPLSKYFAPRQPTDGHNCRLVLSSRPGSRAPPPPRSTGASHQLMPFIVAEISSWSTSWRKSGF